jgi:hypothetical protein
MTINVDELPYCEVCAVGVYYRNDELNGLIKRFVGPCFLCGEREEHTDMLDWHHVRPEDKKFGIADVLRLDRAFYLYEIPKVVLVCNEKLNNCHAKYHANPVKDVTWRLECILDLMNSGEYVCGIKNRDWEQLNLLFTRQGLTSRTYGQVRDEFLDIVRKRPDDPHLRYLFRMVNELRRVARKHYR